MTARHGAPARRAAARRAMTLVELLIVLGLLVAIGAIALPSLLKAAERRRFEAAVAEVVGTLRLARAHARLESATVEVVAIADDDESLGTLLMARIVELDELTELDGELAPEATPSGIDAPWARRTMPVRIGTEGKQDDEPGSGPRLDPDASASEHRGAEMSVDPLSVTLERRAGSGTSRRLALFAADGSAPIAGAFQVRDAEGRTATVRVNPWTGLASGALP